MRETIVRYLWNCEVCKFSKITHYAYHRYSNPLLIPQGPWDKFSRDFVSGLPTSNVYDCVLVVVDRLLKMRHLILCQTTVDA